MGLKIYDRNGGLRIEVQPSDSSSQTAELQGDDVLSMSFTHHGYAGLEVDDYVDFGGVRYRMTERYRPKQKSAMEWEYSIKLYGPESLLRDVLVIKNFEGEQEAEFTLTAPPAEHVALVVSALNGGSGGEWKRGTVTGTENITIDYFGKYCDEALREIAEKAGTEYWTDGTTVNVCRCEHGEPLTLGLADGLTRIEPATAGNVKFYTRLFPMGSTRNIDAESYGHRRLQLPDGAKYVEINADRYRRKDHYEEAAFAGIYPRYTGTVSSVRSETRKGADGEDFTVYYFKDDALPFNPDDYLMAGKVMRISFQEGSDLGGLGDEDNGTYYFETNWHADTGEFELITIWPYKDSATQLPGGVLVPKAGDKYIPWNIRMPQEYYTLAEAEFAAAVQKYNADHDVDLTVFKAQTDHVWVEDNAADLFVGRRVRLVSDRYFPATGYRDSRITKISRKINLPAQMEVEIGDALGRSSKTKITDDIRDARDYARSIGNSVSLPDIIRTGDTTRPTDNNLMSALRIIKDFLCKYKDDRTAHKLATDKAFEVGEFLAGVSGGFFGIDQNGDSYLEVARLYARVRAVFEELTVIKTGVLAGKQYITPGGGIVCTKVEEVKNASGTLTGWRCYFLSEQDGEKTECKFRVNDQAISAVFNAATGTANKVSNHRYWRLVTAVDNDAYTDDSGNHYGYIELSAADCEAGSDTPQAGDEICQFGYRGTDEPRRQTAMVFSTVDADAPSIKLFRGINSYTLDGKAVVQFGVDAQSGKVFFRLGASNATHYLDYTEAGGLQVAGKISTLSTLDDTNTTLGTAISSKVEDTDVLWRLHTSQTDAPALPVLDADGTITDFKGWQTDAPAAVSGQFVWTTTYVRYGNSTAKFDGTACVTGRDGKDGKDGVTMTSEVVEYAIGTSGTVAPTSGWSTTIPAVPKGQYQWTRVTTTYSDGTPTVSYSVAYIPKDGEDGADGANGAGYSVNLVLQSDVEVRNTNYEMHRYYLSEDLVVGETYTWTIWGTPASDKYFRIYPTDWVHRVGDPLPISDGVRSIVAPWTGGGSNALQNAFVVLAYPHEPLGESVITKVKVEKGANPNPVWTPAPLAIVSTSITYAKNTTGIQPPDASFTASAIGELGTISGGDYIWSKTEVAYTDGTVLKSYAVSRIGSDGETQIAGLHIAYATGITGSLPHPTAVTGFSTTMVAGVTYKYIGIRKDNSVADSTNFADYDWAEFRGSDGQNGASYSNNMLVGTKDWSGAIQKGGSTATSAITTELHNGLTVMTTGNKAWQCYYFNLNLEAGKEYTISADAFCTEQNLTTALNMGNWGLSYTSKVTVIDKHVTTVLNSWSRVWLRFRCTQSGNGAFGFENGTTTPIKFAGMKLEEGLNDAPTWSPHPSEMVGTPAKVVIVNAPQLVFTYENNFATIVGAQQIVIQSTLQGTTGRQWSYRPGNASGFTDYPNATGETFTVPHNNSTYFPNGAKSCTFRCTSGDVYDELTISKVSSGSKGADGANYTENLVADSGTAITTAGYLIKDFHTTEDLVEGEKYTLSIWGELAAGKVFNVYDNKGSMFVCQPKLKADGLYVTQFTWKKSANATNASFHVYNFPSSVSGTSTINKIKLEHDYNDNPVWTPAPADGDGITVILTNESHVFEGDTEKAKTGSTECGVIAYKGATQVAATIGTITGAPADMSVSIQDNGTASAKFTVNVTTAMTTKQGVLTIPVTVDGKSFTKKFSWSVSLEGQPGADYSENLLADAEFRGMAASEKVARWSLHTGVSVDNTHMMEGRNSIKSAQRGLTTDSYRGVSQAYEIDVKPGDVFTGSIWTYCEKNSDIKSAALELIPHNGSTRLGPTYSVSIRPTKVNEWQQFKITGTMPANANRVHFFSFVTLNGTMWFSSPKLERGSNTSPVWTPNPSDRIPVLSEEYYRSSSDTELSGGSWSATKQPFAANTYYWTRIKKLYGDGTIETTTPICATGTPALRLDLTNEMAGVACNASGTPVSGALPVKSTAVVYKGGGTDSGWLLAVSADGCTASVNNTTKEISVTALDSNADTATVTVTATKTGYNALTATMSIHKVKPGADGQPATVYQIEPSTNVIKRDMAGTPHPTTLTVTKYRTTGAAAREATTEKFLHAIQKNAAGNTVSSVVNSAATTTINIAPDTVEVVLELRPVADTGSNVSVLDRETVPVITDVADMEVATRNLLLTSGDWNMPDGVFISDDWWWDDLSVTGSNGNLKMTCNATSGNRCAYEKLSIRKAAEGTTMTLRVKGRVSGRTSGHIYFQLVSNWASWQTVGQVAANGEFDLIKTFKLTDEWNGDTILAYGFSNANSGISLELEHAGLYIGNVIPTQWTAAPEDGSYLLKAIQRARQDSTEIDGGLILATLLQLGITDVSGVRKIMSGISGICMKDTDPAIWMGGDMIDREAAADNPDCAKGMFRHNATGYLANGVFRILKDAIEIVDAEKRVTGDLSVVRLDKQGLHLFDSSGRQALLVSSAPVGISTATAARATKIGSTVNATFTYSASSVYKLVASGTSGWNQNIMFSSPVTVADDFASATLTLDMLVTPTGSWSALAGVRPYFEFVVRVMYNDGYEEFTFSQFVDAPGNSKTYTHSFQFSPAKGRKINGVQIINQVATAASGAVSYGTQLRYKATVDVTYGFPDCVRIGGNGMQATLGGARLSCFRPDDGGNGETEMSFTGPNGTFGLKVTSSGFKYRNVNMSSWADWNPGT